MSKIFLKYFQKVSEILINYLHDIPLKDASVSLLKPDYPLCSPRSNVYPFHNRTFLDRKIETYFYISTDYNPLCHPCPNIYPFS